MIEFLEILKVFVLGIIEGVMEWLPVSSTGHMILFDELVSLNMTPEFYEVFLVVIQLGAIAAVPILFFDKLWPFGKAKTKEDTSRILMLWLKVIVGVIPAGVLGILLDDLIDEILFDDAIKGIVVAAALIIYGIAFIVIERVNKNKEATKLSVYDLSFKDAIFMGGFQVLSLVPGTSRSGSTILGGLIGGVSRTAASEFSFFMAIPVMLGASLLKILKYFISGFSPDPFEIILLLLGMAVSFVVSLLAIKFLMNFVKTHSFAVFGYYRIILGIIVLAYFALRAFV